MNKPPLLTHQGEDIEWEHSLPGGRGLLANEPGTGKSRSAIESFDGGKNLIVAPNLVIEGGTWSDELERWSADPSLWTVVPYSQLNARVKTGRSASATRPIERLRAEYDTVYDNIVIDEAHYIKGRDTTWTWATTELTKRADRVLLMTGTPIPNWAHELFTLLKIIFPHEAHPGGQFGSFWRWAEEWFRIKPGRGNAYSREIGDLLQCGHRCSGGTVQDPCIHYREFVRENLGSNFRRVLREDCLDLPPATESTIRVVMDTKQKKAYHELKKHYMTEVGDSEVLAWSQGSLNVLLDRVTTSTWCIDPVGPAKGGKFERLRFDLSNRSRPTLVLAHYQNTVEGCVDVARQVGATSEAIHGKVSKQKRGNVIEQFKAGKLDVLVGSLDTLAEGLTLTQADMAIFVEKSYKPSRNEQAKYRIHRIGQVRPVTLLDYVTPNSVDARKRDLLEVKTDRQMKFLTAAQFKELL